MKKILLITIPVILGLSAIAFLLFYIFSPTEDDKKCKDILDYVGDYKKSFKRNGILLSEDSYGNKDLRWTFTIKSQDFNTDIVKDCNNVKNDIERYLNEHPDYFLLKDNYKINILFTKGKQHQGFTISNYNNYTEQMYDNLCFLSFRQVSTCKYFKYMDGITYLDGEQLPVPIEGIKEMPSLKTIYFNNIAQVHIDYLKKEMPDCEIIYKKIIE